MTEARESLRGQARLQAWLSPAFPTGGFAWSGGLEAAGLDADDLHGWFAASLAHGSIRADAVLCAAAWRGEPDAADVARARSSCATRRAETLEQGAAFLAAARDWNDELARPDEAEALPVAVGSVAQRASIDLDATLVAFVHASLAAQIAAAQRLGLIGQRDGVRLLAGLEGGVLDLASWATGSTLDDLGTMTFAAEVAAMRHETLASRIFRS